VQRWAGGVQALMVGLGIPGDFDRRVEAARGQLVGDLAQSAVELFVSGKLGSDPEIVRAVKLFQDGRALS